MSRSRITLKPESLNPTGADKVTRNRRRAVLVEAGIEHEELARILSRGRERPLSRSAITNILGGYYTSEGYNLERRLVEEVRERLRGMGLAERAEEITMEYLGWPPTLVDATMAGS